MPASCPAIKKTLGLSSTLNLFVFRFCLRVPRNADDPLIIKDRYHSVLFFISLSEMVTDGTRARNFLGKKKLRYISNCKANLQISRAIIARFIVSSSYI